MLTFRRINEWADTYCSRYCGFHFRGPRYTNLPETRWGTFKFHVVSKIEWWTRPGIDWAIVAVWLGILLYYISGIVILTLIAMWLFVAKD